MIFKLHSSPRLLRLYSGLFPFFGMLQVSSNAIRNISEPNSWILKLLSKNRKNYRNNDYIQEVSYLAGVSLHQLSRVFRHSWSKKANWSNLQQIEFLKQNLETLSEFGEKNCINSTHNWGSAFPRNNLKVHNTKYETGLMKFIACFNVRYVSGLFFLDFSF